MPHQSRLTIDLSALLYNYRRLKNAVSDDCVVSAVIKANAYGLGYERIAPVLEEEGCTQFFVATPFEGQELRAITTQDITVLCAYLDAEIAAFMVQHRLTPCLNCLEHVYLWAAMCSRLGKTYPAFLQLDTGMKRVGLSMDDVETLNANPTLFESIDIRVIMTHFASADDPLSGFTLHQQQRFDDMVSRLPESVRKNATLCMANSAGTAFSSDFHYDMVRPGKSLFGLKAIEEYDRPFSFISPVTLEGRVIQIQDVNIGQPVGYNETFTALEPMVIATVALGYADGLKRGLSNIGHLYFKSQKCPIVGRVSMDMVMVRIDQLDCETPQLGNWVQYLNTTQTPDDIAALVGTNGYEILTGLGKRPQRIYIESGVHHNHFTVTSKNEVSETGQRVGIA